MNPKDESTFETVKRVKAMSEEELRQAAQEIHDKDKSKNITVTLQFEGQEPISVVTKALILFNESKDEPGALRLAVSLVGNRATLMTLISSIPEAIDEKMGKGSWEEAQEVSRLMHFADVV